MSPSSPALPGKFKQQPKSLYLLPLGGTGEFGMNLTLYGHGGKWLMVDLGMGFAEEDAPGAELLFPDPAFISERRQDLLGLVITHAHEDHIGAVSWLWPELQCPIYCTPFAALLLREKLEEKGMLEDVEIHEIPQSGNFSLGPFEIETVGVTHSVPEAMMLAITTGQGTVVHTGDWKFDPNPVVGALTNKAALERIGKKGVLALACDSTNILVEGRSGSESDLNASLEDIFKKCPHGIVATCFSSNVSRMITISRAAQAVGRKVALVGRSLRRIEKAARKLGYMKDVPEFPTDKEAVKMPRDRVVFVATGSQGEPRSAMWKLAQEEHPVLALHQGDTVIFSSRTIPGNEKSVIRLQNMLARLGAEIITSSDELVHVSGHSARDEMRELYAMLKPEIVVPVHGEYVQMQAQGRLAKECGVAQVVLPQNGGVIRLAPGKAEVVAKVQSGILALDGTRLVPLESEALHDRNRIMSGGMALVSVVVDREGRLSEDPQVTLTGVVEDDVSWDAEQEVSESIASAMGTMGMDILQSDEALEDHIRVAVRRSIKDISGKKPVTVVHIVRI
ncbi:MAG: MBL fold hydrolase [Alphaproteobacteria bacterium GWF2_58_20]|nr:MAG: MBL fold hydrolase [Alphaproteobacteria bacterium GWF2_58_20]